MIGGYAVVGAFSDASSGQTYASLQACRDYCGFVRSRALPLGGKPRNLAQVKQADEETRALWAERMRSGLTFDQAVEKCESKVAALWLFSTSIDVAEAIGDAPSTPDGRRGKRAADSVLSSVDKKPRVLGRQASNEVVEETGKGKSICKLWNDGKCEKSCKHNRLHICNFRMPSGKPCGATGHRRCDAH